MTLGAKSGCAPLATRGGSDLPEKNPEDFLFALHQHILGSYLFATELHESRECPNEELIVPLQPVGRRNSELAGRWKANLLILRQ